MGRVAALVVLVGCGAAPARVAAPVAEPPPVVAASGPDACPDAPEDLDGFDDDDGCPDLDDDGDLVLDACDACPNEPEAYDGYTDWDGCPDDCTVIECEILVHLEPVGFPADDAVVPPSARPALDDAVAVLAAEPEARLAILGSAAYDERDAAHLAEARANAVLEALVSLGVARSLLHTRGDVAMAAAAAGESRRVDFAVGCVPTEPPPEPDLEVRPPPAPICPTPGARHLQHCPGNVTPPGVR